MGRGGVFLKLFLQRLDIACEDLNSAKVFIEYPIGNNVGNGKEATGGRLDILIKLAPDNLVVIENKLDAIDQPDQLIRYHNFNPKGCIQYLTKDGKEPSESSAHQSEVGKDYYKCISYKEHILKWLEACQKESVNQPRIREGIAHYIELVKYLTNQTLNEAMEEKIIEKIMQSPERVAAAFEIQKLVGGEALTKKIMEKLFNALEPVLEDGHDLASKNLRSWDMKNVGLEYGVYIYIKEVDDVHLFWTCAAAGNSQVFTGVIARQSKSLEKLAELNRELGELRSAVQEKIGYDESFEKSKGEWLLDRFITPKLDFRLGSVSPEMIDAVINDGKLTNLVNEIARQADIEIKLLQTL